MPDFFVGRPAPDFRLKDLDGHDVQLASFRGNVVVVDFWASWCGPCGAEIPAIGIVRKFVAQNKLTHSIALTTDNPAVIHAYGAQALPTVALIDKNGIIAAYRVGENPDMERICGMTSVMS